MESRHEARRLASEIVGLGLVDLVEAAHARDGLPRSGWITVG
jgi:hypothetical protein